MPNTFGSTNPQNMLPSVYVSEYSFNPSTPGAQPIQSQQIGVGAAQAVSQAFQPQTTYITMSPQFLASGTGTISVTYAVGIPPFTNASISTALNGGVTTTLAVATGQSIAFRATGTPLNN